MKNLTTIIFVIITFILISCNPNKKQTINIENRYQINLPKTLSKQEEMNDIASLEYGNIFSELYTMVIDETVEDVNEGTEEDFFTALSLEEFMESFKKDKLAEGIFDSANFEQANIGGFPAYICKEQGKSNGLDIYFNIALIKSQKAFYQI